MSGDVQPRKRKDKKKKKDDLGVEEPRGTAAALGEGDVFMHSYSDHGTGGHWCAKVIFFSLLAVLITLIGLIILENRGLTELEANSVESRYSGVLEGWIEDAPDDDHHDEHTLELNHHDEDDEEHGSQLEHDDEDENHDDDNDEHEDVDDEEHDNDDSDEEHENDEDEETENDEDDDNENDEGDDNDDETEQDVDDSEEADADDTNKNYDDANQDREEQNADTAEEDEDENSVDDDSVENQQEDDEENDHDLQENDSVEKDNEEDNALENNDDDDSEENDDFLQNDAAKEDDDDHDEEVEVTNNIEIETIEKEVSDDDVAPTEEPAQEEDDDNQDDDVSEELPPEDDTSVEDDDVEFLEPDELDELPIIEPITAPKGKPLPEVGDSPSTEKPQDTLADEEEYERQQEELRREREQASQGMWLKLTVGGALLVATHAVLRRATASREVETEDEPDSREETPLSDRRITLISEPVSPPTVAPKAPEVRPKEKEVEKEAIVKSSPPKEDSEEEEEETFVSKPIQPIQSAQTPKDTIDKELYSDEDVEEEIEDEEEEEIIPIKPTKSEPQQAVPQAPIPDVTKEVTPEPDDDDDVEIIDEEQLEDEMEEEEISDVDDAELLTRLEEKYGRLPDPEPARPPRHKDGGNSIEDDWPGEPADAFWSQRLEQAQREMREGDWAAALETASSPALVTSGRARYIIARALDAAAEAKKDNQVLSKAIAAYLEVLKMNERLSDAKLLEVASRALDRIKFRGTYLSAEPVYKLLIRRFPKDPAYRNNLTISLLMANRVDLAENVLKETLKLWPNDRVALAHHGFILKTLHNRLEEAVEAFSKALEGDAGAANEPRFYYHLGDALILLGRFDDAHKIHKRGAELGHFLSPAQRSLYNVNRLKSKPWWNVHQTPYSRLARALEKSWKEILKEGEAAKALYEKEKEGLKERGEWSQLDLFVRGREVPDRCSRATVTCGIIKSEIGASGCRRGQIKFSMMEAGTHVRPHVGPTNCRLRMHLGLSNTKDTFLRVDQETRQWQTGKVLMFDDSFEHEVWHNGTGTRLVLIVDVWHPDLTPTERRQLPAI